MKPSVIEAKKAQAMQAHAEGLAEVNRKLDAIMAHLGIGVPVVVDPAEPVTGVTLTAMSEPEPEPEPEVDSVVEKPKSNKKK